MCFDFCNDDDVRESHSSWNPPCNLGETTISQPSFGGGLGESTVVQTSFGGGLGGSTIVQPSFGGFDTNGGLGTSTTWTPSQPDGFVINQEIGGGMGSAVMSQPSYGGGLGSAMMSTPSDGGFVTHQTIQDGSGQGLGQSTYTQSSY